MDIKYQIKNISLLPFYAKFGDAGMDLMASEEIIIKRGETKIIPTGLSVEIPLGFEFQIRDRSGLVLRTPLRVANAPGTIDSGYRDEIGVIMTNTSIYGIKKYYIDEKENKQGTYIIRVGDRIAQIVLSKVYEINFVNSQLDMSNNRQGGFGSTGTSIKTKDKGD